MNRLSKSRKLAGAAVLIALAGVAIWDMTRRGSGNLARAGDESTEAKASSNSEKPTRVEVTKASARPLKRVLRMPATLMAGEAADLHAKASGYISKIHVNFGSVVKKGDPLVEIDVPEMHDDLKQAKANLQAKEAKAAKARSMVDIAKAELQRANAELRIRRITLERVVELRRGDAIPQQQLDEAQGEFAISEAKINIARAQIQSREADVRVADAQVAVSRARLSRLETLMQYATIRAPFDGVITDRRVDPGAFVRSAVEGDSDAVIRVSRVDFVRVVLKIPESDANDVRVGTPVEIFVRGLSDGPLQARITRSAEALQPRTRTMHTEIDIDNADGRLKPGMYVQARVILESKARAMMIPSKSIRVRGRKMSVLVVVNGRVAERKVSIGYDDGIWAEVKGGDLRPTEPIIVSATNIIAPGLAVIAESVEL